MVKRVIAGLTQNTSVQRLALLDGHAYDAFPALSTLEAGLSFIVFIESLNQLV